MNIFFTAFEVFKLADLSSYCTSIYYIYISLKGTVTMMFFLLSYLRWKKNQNFEKYCTYHEPNIRVVDP
jgi:hypothetical protein